MSFCCNLFNLSVSISLIKTVEQLFSAKMSIFNNGNTIQESKNFNKGTEIIKLNDTDNSDIISRCVKVLQKGGLVALPTDTIYGIGCLAQCTEAIDKLYAIKGRHTSKPVAICVGETYDVCQWTRFPPGLLSLVSKKVKSDVEKENREVSDALQSFLNDLLPGPITIVVERSPALNSNLNPKTSSVGIRVPNNDFIRSLTNRLREPLALTSANISGEESSVCIKDFTNLWDKLDLVVDGGIVGSKFVNKNILFSKEGSTVVKIMSDGISFRVLREGCAYEGTVRKLQDNWNLKLIC